MCVLYGGLRISIRILIDEALLDPDPNSIAITKKLILTLVLNLNFLIIYLIQRFQDGKDKFEKTVLAKSGSACFLDPGSGSAQFFGLKILKFFNADPDPRSGIVLTWIGDEKVQIRDPT